jgi:serine/threonine protein kinase
MSFRGPQGPNGLVGQTISHYHIVEKLGGGGMGGVYRARVTRLDRTAAIKVLPANRMTRADVTVLLLSSGPVLAVRLPLSAAGYLATKICSRQARPAQGTYRCHPVRGTGPTLVQK